MLKAWQATVQNEVLVGGVSPFSTFTNADAALYGATGNPGDAAIYIGFPPKDIKTIYTTQCWIMPLSESVRWRNNPHVFDESNVYCLVLGYYVANYYSVTQNMVSIRDVFHTVIGAHAEQPNDTLVTAAKWGSVSGHANGFFMTEEIGRDWLCWGATRWMRQQWSVKNNIQT